MGNCFGKCLPRREDISSKFNILLNSNSDSSYIDNVSFCENTSVNESKKSFLSRLFDKGKLRKKKPVLHLVDGLLHQKNNLYNRLKEPNLPLAGSSTSNDIQLHSLDARALLPLTNQSSPTTSLDLEWEHEPLPFFMVVDRSENSSKNITSDSRPESGFSLRSTLQTGPNSDCTQASSANSLEWDSLYPTSPPASEIDADTQVLLGEIERLTKQTLSETGRDYLPS